MNLSKVAIIMGSESDWPIIQKAAEVLDEFNVPYKKEIISAHRSPEKMMEFASKAKNNGFEIIIAGAGGAAHLPGMVASMTTLPVIGVPVKQPSLDGLDSLLSIVQMPKGVPVATVAIDNAYNAGILALRILGLNDREIAKKLDNFHKTLRDKVSLMNENINKE